MKDFFHLVLQFNLGFPERSEDAVVSFVTVPDGFTKTLDKDIFHQNELIYFERLEFAKRKLEYYLGRYAAKLAFNKFFEQEKIAHDQIEITAGTLSQPILKCSQMPYSKPLDITISHSGGLAGSILSPMGIPLGIDIERSDQGQEKIFGGEFKVHELPTLSKTLESIRGTLTWTMMESLSKAIKYGFRAPIELYQLSNWSEASDGSVDCEYKHLSQFKGKAWVFGTHILAITYPQSCTLSLTKNDLAVFFQKVDEAKTPKAS